MSDSSKGFMDACSEAVRTVVVTNRWLCYWNVLVTGLLVVSLVVRK